MLWCTANKVCAICVQLNRSGGRKMRKLASMHPLFILNICIMGQSWDKIL